MARKWRQIHILGSRQPSRLSAFAPRLQFTRIRTERYRAVPVFYPTGKSSTNEYLFVPDWRIFRPGGTSIVPEGKIFQPSGRSFVPDWKVFQPSGRSFVPDWKVFRPGGTSFVPDGSIFPPTSRVFGEGVW